MFDKLDSQIKKYFVINNLEGKYEATPNDTD